MSCILCNLRQSEFSSEIAYLGFKKKLQAMVDAGLLTKVHREKSSGAFLSTEYLCNKCKSRWMLFEPDQAYRGGWNEIT